MLGEAPGAALYPVLMLVAGSVFAAFALYRVRRAHVLAGERSGGRGGEPGDGEPGGPQGRSAALGVHEAAFLAGGAWRTAETAVAEAVFGGRAAVDGSGRLAESAAETAAEPGMEPEPGTGASTPEPSPEARAALACLGAEGPMGLERLLRRLEQEDVSARARAAVTGHGYFLGNAEVLQALTRRRSVLRVGWLGMAVAGVLAVALLFAGALTGAVSPEGERWWAGPAGGMAVLFFIIGAVLLIDRLAGPERLAPVTPAGKRALAEANDALDAEEADAGGAADPYARAVRLVALDGLVEAVAQHTHLPGRTAPELLTAALGAVEPPSWAGELMETALGDGGGPWLGDVD